MFINDHTYFEKKLEVDEARELLKNYRRAREEGDKVNSIKYFQAICKHMKNRVNQNYFSPIKGIIRYTEMGKGNPSTGFVIMGINCILIEFYYEMRNGLDVSNEGNLRVCDAYKTVLPMLSDDISMSLANRFYKGIRCGIIHQGQTKDDTAITFDYDAII